MVCNCGKPLRQYRKTCGDPACVRLLQGHFKGKKRPHHSELMKIKAKEGKLDNWINSSSDHLNNAAFKRTRLTRHNIKFTDNTVDDEYRNLLSAVQKTTKSTINQLTRFIVNENFIHEPEFMQSELNGIDEEYITALTDSLELNRLKVLKNSIKSTVSMRLNPKMGNSKSSKHELLSNLKFNLNGKTSVYVKSSYEKNYVLFFEQHNIKWDYEPFTIKTDTGYYIPDIIFDVNDNRYLLEIKGYIKDFADYYTKKLRFAIEYCKQHNMTMLYSKESNITNIDQLLLEEIK